MNEIIQGEAREVLSTIQSETVHCCVTSPPYWGLRDYGEADQLGLEPTPEEYVARLVGIFEEVRRVLRDDGTLWLNLGDSYTSGNRDGHGALTDKQRSNRVVADLKPKDLVGIPWMVAFALRSAGWYLRQEIIWHKPAQMPESVKDRCTKAHEQIFLLSKSPRYFYDADAIAEPCVSKGKTAAHQQGRAQNDESRWQREENGLHSGESHQGSGKTTRVFGDDPSKANKRSVWTVNTKPYKGAHFATFPPALIEPMIRAGCPEGGVVLDPFMGSGTTAYVARRLGRNYLGVELNPAYIELANKRLAQKQLF